VLVGLASGEKPGVGQGFGLALAVFGVVLAVRSRDDGTHRVVTEATSTSVSTPEPVRSRASYRRGVVSWLAAGAAVAIGTSLVFLKHASESDVFAALLVSRAAGLMTIAFVLAATRTTPRLPPSRTPALLAIGVLDMLATALFALASTQGLLSVVAVASSLYPAATAVLARLALDERLTRTQVAGIVSVLLGVCLIAADG
jgi:drug/metabolite transporter (DMT)-like permease